MTIRDDRRSAAIGLMADHLLEKGLAGASLRPMAAAAGISDRMLLYYFTDKDDVLAATLGEVAQRLALMLEAGAPTQMPFRALLSVLWSSMRIPTLMPYISLWLEVAAASSRGVEPYRRIGGAIADGFLAWTAQRLLVEDEADRPHLAALLLSTFDGLAMLDAVGRSAQADAAVAAWARL